MADIVDPFKASPAASDGGIVDPFAPPTISPPTQAAPAPLAPPAKSGLTRRIVGDSAIDLGKGVIDLGQAAVGLADIPTGGYAGKALESVGYDPQGANDFLSDFYSPERKQANQNVADVHGFLPTVGAMLKNPSTIAGSVLESAPSTVAGGAGVARGLVAKALPLVERAAPALAKYVPMLAGGVGEGAIQTGQAAEQTRTTNADKLLTAKQSGAAIASGAVDALITTLGGATAQKLGIADIDTLLAGGKTPVNTGKKGVLGVLKRALEGVVQEGVLEELPQSAQEQLWQNYATGQPLMQGVPEAAAQGAITGAVQGGATSAVVGGHGKPETKPESNSTTPQPAPVVAPSPDMLASAPAAPVETARPMGNPDEAPGILTRVRNKSAELFPDAQPGSLAAVANAAVPAHVDPATGEYLEPTDDALKAQIHASVEDQIASAGKISRTRTRQALPGIVPRRADALIDAVMAERKQGITAANYAENPSVDQPALGSLSAVAASVVPTLGESGAAAAGEDQSGPTVPAAAASDHGQAAAPAGDLRREANPVADEPAGARAEGLNYNTSSQLEDGDVTPPSGEPFTHERAAELQAKRHEGGKVFPVDGGFVVRVPQAVEGPQNHYTMQTLLEGTPAFDAHVERETALHRQVSALSKADATKAAEAVGGMKALDKRDPHDYLLKQHPDDIEAALKSVTPSEAAANTDQQSVPAESPRSRTAAEPSASTRTENQPSSESPASPVGAADQAHRQAPTSADGQALANAAPAPAGDQVSDFAAQYDARVKASKDAGNTHLDQLPRDTSMRGKVVVSAHDPKVRGTVRTVDRNGNVYVDWADQYSADKEMASETKEGKRTVMRSSLGPSDLKDYVVAQPAKPAAHPQATQPESAPAAPAPQHPVQPVAADTSAATTNGAVPTAGESAPASGAENASTGGAESVNEAAVRADYQSAMAAKTGNKDHAWGSNGFADDIVRALNREPAGIEWARKHLANGSNETGLRVFAKHAGITMPRTQKGQREAIDAWAGIKPEDRAASDAKETAEKAQAKEQTTAQRQARQPVPDFKTYAEAQSWAKHRASAFKSEGQYRTTDEYRDYLAKARPLYEKALAEQQAQAKTKTDAAGIKAGDQVTTSQIGAFLTSETWTGTVFLKNGMPWVRINNGGTIPTSKNGKVSRARSVRWDDRWKKADAAQPVAQAATKRRAPTEAQKAEGIVATQGPADAKGERKFYVTMLRDSRTARLAGPFDTKEEAESHVKPARELAEELDPRASFDAFGVSAITSENHQPGKLNERLGLQSQPKAETREAFEVDGARVYPVSFKGEPGWAVQQPQNRGTDKVLGDTLHRTREQATTEARRIMARERQRQELAQAQVAAKKQAESKKADDLNGFAAGMSALQAGKVKQALGKKVRFDGVVMTLRERVESLHAEGAIPLRTFTESKIKPMSRTQFNRATQHEQDAHERKMKEAGDKTVYLVDGSDIGKIAYDYATFLNAQQAETNSKATAADKVSDQPTSWVLREKATGKVIAETRDPKKVAALNTDKYEAVPVKQHLAELNQPESLAVKAARQESSPAPREAGKAKAVALENVEPATPFYSAALRAIEAGKGAPKRGPYGQWKGWLDGAVRRGEFKQSERDWLGLDDWIKSQGDVTKQQLADYVRANQVQVKDVVLGAGDRAELPKGWNVERQPNGEWFVSDDEGWTVGTGDTRAAALEDAQDPDERGSLGAKFASYQLPGGENYRELLLTLPPSNSEVTPDAVAQRMFGKSYASLADDERALADNEIENVPRGRGANVPADEFRSSHFDQPNILAHVRFNDRTDADGKKVLFVEEIQSDWHQQGRKRGYGHKFIVRHGNAQTDTPMGVFATRAEAEAFAKKWNDENPYDNYGADVREEVATPDAPFKGTDEWAMLAFKRAVAEAVKSGADKIAWTTGTQQAERYDLSKQVRDVFAAKRFDGYVLTVTGNNGDTIFDSAGEAMPADKLEEYVGKELAEKIVAEADAKGKTYSGLDLKVGGQGMKGFYDTILPAAVNKWAKRFGGKVGATTLQTEAARDALNTKAQRVYGEDFAALNADEQKQVLFLIRNEMDGDLPTVHSLQLTPAMREAALGGLPLFNTEQAQELSHDDLTPAEKEAFDRAQNTSEAKTKAEALSKAQGEADAHERGFHQAIKKVLGDQANRVEYVRDYAGLPEELRNGVESRNAERNGKVQTAAVYDPASKRVFLVTSVIKTPDRAVWNALHEIAGHDGLRKLLGTKLDAALTIALQNPTVKQLADAIMADRSMDRSQKLLAAEESLAELAAAVRTGNFDHIESRYGVKVGDGIREQQSLKAAIANFLKRLQALLDDLLGRHVFLDEDVRALLDAAYQASQSVDGKVSGGMAEQTVYHGTPHRGIEKFSLQKIGTGEGAQAFGWGMYFASSKDIAEHYRAGLSTRDFINKAREAYDEFDSPEDAAANLREIDGLSEPQRELIDALQKDDWLGFDYPHQAIQAAMREPQNFELSPETQAALAKQGQLYKVDVPEDSDLLDWDKPLSEQPQKVQDVLRPALEARGGSWEKDSGQRIYRTLAADGFGDASDRAKTASEYLNSIGIPGLRYLDGSSRGTQGKPTLTVDGAPLTPSMSMPHSERDGITRLLRSNGNVDAAIAEARDVNADPAEVAYLKSLRGKNVAVSRERESHNYVIWDEAAIGQPQGLLENTEASKPSILENVEPIAKRAKEHSPEVIADIEAVMDAGSDKTLLQQAKDKLAALVPAKVKDQLRPTWLAALSTDMLAELGSDYHANMQHYADFLKAMNADRNELQQQGEEVSEAVRQWGSKHPEQAKDLFKLMHQATIDGVDPAKEYQPLQFRFNGKLNEVNRKNITDAVKIIRQQMRERSGDSKKDLMDEVKKLNAMLKAEPGRKAQYPVLQQKWAALSSEAQAHYVAMRDAYAERSQMIEDGLVQRIEDTDAPDNHKRKLITLIRQQFETQRLQGVYFPLQRFGQYFVSASKGETDTFLMFESLNKLEAGVRSLKQRGFTVNAQGLKSQGKAIDAPSGTFVADVIAKLKAAHISEATQDDIYQMYLQALPELSLRKHAIHRQAVPGFDPDAVRGFAFNMLHGAHQIARLRYAHKLADTITLLKAQQDAKRREPEADTRKVAAGDAILNELQLRHQWIMNPTDSKLTGLVSSFGFLYYLGLTPAAAMVNLTQTALLTFPYLAARHGPVKAMNHLLTGMRDSIRTGGHIQKHLTNPDELRMHAELQRRGVLDKTQAFNLAGIAEGGLAGHNPQWAKAMQIIGLPFHKAEVVNREASSIAAYRLAREDGKSHEQAVDAAARAVNDTHFDYTNQNRARVFQSGTAKTLLMFRQYSLNMTWHMGRMLWQATKNADPEVKKIARRNLAGVLGMSALFSGTMGLPLMSVTFGILNAIAASFGNDDEPWDAETEFRAFLDAMFGKGAGAVIADGGVNALTGADIASRVSLSQLWFRDADRELDGRGAYYNLLEQAAGPMGGVLKNALVGKQMIDEGHTLRGIETMLPKALKDTLKAQRYAAEGVNNLRGDPLVQDVSLRDTLLQLSGFTPADVAKQYDVNRSLKNYEQAILDRRGYLLDAFAMAIRTEDPDARQEVLAKIQQFNRTNPEIAITTKGIRNSLASRARYSQDAENGISLNKHLAAKLHARVDGTD